MSADCGDPNCPQHGDNPEAIANRETRQRILVNEEMMATIRILAGNSMNNEANSQGVHPFDPTLMLAVKAILNGDNDSDPYVQGIIDGFVMLLRSHRPTQEYYNLLNQVPEAESSIRSTITAIHEESRGPRVLAFTSIAQLLAFLKGQGGG